MSILEEYEFLKNKKSNSILLGALPHFSLEVQRYFYQYDKRAKEMIRSEYDFLEHYFGEIAKEPCFLDLLKCDSMVLFRYRIEKLSKKNASLELFQNVKTYYRELLASYDMEKELFLAQEKVLNLERNELASLKPNIFVSRQDIGLLKEMNREEREKYLQRKSTLLLSEIIVDSLFSDNYYNVCLNIEELLKYSKVNRLLSQEKRKFYEKILKMDTLSPEEKLQVYDKGKDYNIAGMFYEDMRTCRDQVVKEIKESLTDLKKYSKNKLLSMLYGVDIYDFRKKHYRMLIRDLLYPYENTHLGLRRSCYTYISNAKNKGFCNTPKYRYGYFHFDNAKVLHISERDSCSDPLVNRTGTDFVNRLLTPEELLYSEYGINEIQIQNDLCENGYFVTLSPEVLLSERLQIQRYILKEAKRLHIPILLVRKENVLKEREKKTTITTPYVFSTYEEKRQLQKRF